MRQKTENRGQGSEVRQQTTCNIQHRSGVRGQGSNHRPQRYFAIYFLFLISSILFSCAKPPQPPPELYWPMPPAQPRIKYLEKWSGRDDFGKGSPLLEFLIGKEPVERMKRPTCVAADKDGNIYVTDVELGILFVFDKVDKSMKLYGILGQGKLAAPTGVTIDDKRGIIFVADSKLKNVFGYNMNGKLKLTIGQKEEFGRPSGLAVNSESGLLYISDTKNHNIRIYDLNSNKFISAIGERGGDDGKFNFPTNIALDRNGNLYVSDSFNFRIQIFDKDGKFLKKFGKIGDASGYLAQPRGVAVDSEGHIYVADRAFNNFQIFDQEGQLLLWVGQGGAGPGEFFGTNGIFIDREDRIYVTDEFNNRIQVFKYLPEKSREQ